jgi:hypothetical protein
MDEADHREEIGSLEEQIDELVARIESCRKFILVGKIAVVAGSVGVIATLAGVIAFNPSVLAVAGAALLGGIVVAGSNRSTAKEAAHELRATEARRKALIEQIDLRLASNRHH